MPYEACAESKSEKVCDRRPVTGGMCVTGGLYRHGNCHQGMQRGQKQGNGAGWCVAGALCVTADLTLQSSISKCTRTAHAVCHHAVAAAGQGLPGRQVLVSHTHWHTPQCAATLLCSTVLLLCYQLGRVRGSAHSCQTALAPTQGSSAAQLSVHQQDISKKGTPVSVSWGTLTLCAGKAGVHSSTQGQDMGFNTVY